MTSPTPSGESPRCVSIGMVVGVAAAVALAAAFFRYWQPWPALMGLIVLRVTTLLLGGAILLSAVILGAIVLRLTRLAPPGLGDHVAYAGGIGLGIVSLGTLVLGLLAFMPGLLLGVLLLIVIVIGSLTLMYLRLLDELQTQPRSRPERMTLDVVLSRLPGVLGKMRDVLRAALAEPRITTLLWAIVTFSLVMNLTGVFMPPHEYDVLEYHLAAPAAYNDADRIFFMPDNVYASFPMNLEMLFLVGMRLDMQRDGGTEVGKVVNVGIGLLAALAIAGLGNR